MQPQATTSPNSSVPAFRRRPTVDDLSSMLDAPTGHAAGIVFVDPQKRVLLLRRSMDEKNFGGHWGLPGGGVEGDESPEAGAAREAREELGGTAPEGPRTLLRQVRTPTGLVFHTFLQPVQEPFAPFLADGEHTAFRWSALDDLPEPLHPAVAATFRDHSDVIGDAEFNEGDHPRAPDGKFGSGGGGGAAAPAGSKRIADKIKAHAETFKKHGKEALEFVKDKSAGEVIAAIAKDHRVQHVISYGLQSLLSHGTGIISHATGGAIPEIQGLDPSTWQLNEQGIDHLVSDIGVIAGIGVLQAKDLLRRSVNGLIEQRDAMRAGKTASQGHDAEDGVAAVLRALLDLLDEEDDAQAADGYTPLPDVRIDLDHDVKWLSVMSRDGRTFYGDKSLKGRQVTIGEKTFDPVQPLLRHEHAEFTAMATARAEFVAKNGREPNDDERKAIYLKAHEKFGTPAEKLWCEENGVDWNAWEAWTRGELSRLENEPDHPANPPDDPDVKPFRHVHGALETSVGATDRALTLAMDRDSVREKDRDGRLIVARANISKATVNPYKGSEIPDWQRLGLDPEQIYQLLRHPGELQKAAASFNGVPLLRQHVPVSSVDHRPDDVVGTTGTDAAFDGTYLTNSLRVWAQDAIDDIESGAKEQLSSGYHYVPLMTPGIFGGMRYDGVMTDIVGNHVALVKDGRAGSDVVVGDSNEVIAMATENRDFAKRLAAVAARATSVSTLAHYLRPRLAQDAAIDYGKVFDGVTGSKFKSMKPEIATRLRAQAKDKMAKDASLDDVEKVLDMLDGHEVDGGDESVSEPQHKAMAAAAQGNSSLDIPKKVGAEFLKADKGKTFDEGGFRNFLKEKGMGEDDINTAMGMMPKPATDEDPAEKKKREDAEKAAAAAKDAEMKDMVTKPAMDAAISAAVDATAKKVRESERAIRQAEQDVRPYVGELKMGFDSAEDVYRHALETLGVKGAKDIHGSALKTVLEMQPKAGARAPERTAIALDSAATKRTSDRFGLDRIGAA